MPTFLPKLIGFAISVAAVQSIQVLPRTESLSLSLLLKHSRSASDATKVPAIESLENKNQEGLGVILPDRRKLLEGISTTALATLAVDGLASPSLAYTPEQDPGRPFVSAAYARKELTNSIVASRDTNISPAEVYETILRLKKQGLDGRGSKSTSDPSTARALDVGAGAGVSTQVIFQELGYRNIDAVDWSGDAWRSNVVDGGYCPPSVNFYELDDERFMEKWKREKLEKYDIIAFNFAVNKDKALYFSQNLLKEGGLLLAPINTQEDYWLKQTYQLLDADGKLVWSAGDVGAWAVQFQPDVTQETCQGVWCPPFNGFQKLLR